MHKEKWNATKEKQSKSSDSNKRNLSKTQKKKKNKEKQHRRLRSVRRDPLAASIRIAKRRFKRLQTAVLRGQWLKKEKFSSLRGSRALNQAYFETMPARAVCEKTQGPHPSFRRPADQNRIQTEHRLERERAGCQFLFGATPSGSRNFSPSLVVHPRQAD